MEVTAALAGATGWVGTHRAEHKAGRLSSDRVSRLEALEFHWDLRSAKWEKSFSQLKAHRAQFGDCRVPDKWPENLQLAT